MAKIGVKIRPNGKRNEVSTLDPLVIRISAPPTEGKANEALIRYLSDILDIPQSAIQIVHGANIKQKILEITGLSLVDISARLKKSMGVLL